jgi:hypothetical protein
VTNEIGLGFNDSEYPLMNLICFVVIMLANPLKNVRNEWNKILRELLINILNATCQNAKSSSIKNGEAFESFFANCWRVRLHLLLQLNNNKNSQNNDNNVSSKKYDNRNINNRNNDSSNYRNNNIVNSCNNGTSNNNNRKKQKNIHIQLKNV